MRTFFSVLLVSGRQLKINGHSLSFYKEASFSLHTNLRQNIGAILSVCVLSGEARGYAAKCKPSAAIADGIACTRCTDLPIIALYFRISISLLT